MAKRKADGGPEIQRNLVEVIPLGAGQEVGRSCIILKYMCAVLQCVFQTTNLIVKCPLHFASLLKTKALKLLLQGQDCYA